MEYTIEQLRDMADTVITYNGIELYAYQLADMLEMEAAYDVDE